MEVITVLCVMVSATVPTNEMKLYIVTVWA